MNLQDILAKEKSARSSDELSFVAQHLDQLTDEQKIKEGFAVVSASENKADAAATDNASQKTEAAADTKVEDKKPETVTASEQGAVVISASELEALKASASKGEMAFSELQKSQKQLEKINITEQVKAFQFNEKGGKIAPAQVEPLVNLMLTMSEPQRAELTKVLESLPDRQIFGEQGSDEDLGKSQAKDLLNAKATELVQKQREAGVTLSFGEALQRVANENPQLYMDSLKANNG